MENRTTPGQIPGQQLFGQAVARGFELLPNSACLFQNLEIWFLRIVTQRFAACNALELAALDAGPHLVLESLNKVRKGLNKDLNGIVLLVASPRLPIQILSKN